MERSPFQSEAETEGAWPTDSGDPGSLAQAKTAEAGKCPIDVTAMVSGWAEGDLLCRAGRREMKAGRYVVDKVRDGADLRRSLDGFLALAQRHEKTGALAVIGGAVTKAASVREELHLIAALMHEAGYVASLEDALSGREICFPVAMTCPVSGQPTTYSFFPVVFCRNGANPADDLYDVSLSCPWSMINTTSDAFAFALMVRDRARRRHGCEPYQLSDPATVRALFNWAVTAWQNMSVGTIKAFAAQSVVPSRGVGLSPDARYWTAPHQDPAFAELKKETFAHEMPVLYARALVTKWFATLFAKQALDLGREGQAGGIRAVDLGLQTHELQ